MKSPKPSTNKDRTHGDGSRVLRKNTREPSPCVPQAVEALLAGDPVIFPTDTVYGLGVAVGYAKTPEILYVLKERDHGKPVAWLVGSGEDLRTYGKDVPEYAFTLAETFWPGDLTLVVKAADSVPAAFRAPGDTIALRMPNNETALTLINQVKAPLATTSANISGQHPPETFTELDERLLAKVPVALADETQKSGTASTVVDCTGSHPIIIREGNIPLAALSS